MSQEKGNKQKGKKHITKTDLNLPQLPTFNLQQVPAEITAEMAQLINQGWDHEVEKEFISDSTCELMETVKKIDMQRGITPTPNLTILNATAEPFYVSGPSTQLYPTLQVSPTKSNSGSNNSGKTMEQDVLGLESFKGEILSMLENRLNKNYQIPIDQYEKKEFANQIQAMSNIQPEVREKLIQQLQHSNESLNYWRGRIDQLKDSYIVSLHSEISTIEQMSKVFKEVMLEYRSEMLNLKQLIKQEQEHFSESLNTINKTYKMMEEIRMTTYDDSSNQPKNIVLPSNTNPSLTIHKKESPETSPKGSHYKLGLNQMTQISETKKKLINNIDKILTVKQKNDFLKYFGFNTKDLTDEDELNNLFEDISTQLMGVRFEEEIELMIKSLEE